MIDDIPKGYYLIEKNEEVISGDLWCHNGKVMRFWLPATPGPQQPNNSYCRKSNEENK